MSKLKSLPSLLAVMVAGLLFGPRFGIADAAVSSAPVQRIATVMVPGRPLASFDISAVDAVGGIYALSDRSNGGVDLINLRNDRFLGRVPGFTGIDPGHGGMAGPNGVIAVGAHQFWAGDGNSTIKIVDTRSRKVAAIVATGGAKRVDELGYDPRDHVVVAANNADKPPFLSFISTRGHYLILGRLTFPQATRGLESQVWDAATRRFYVAVPELNGVAAHGAIAVVDPRSRKLLRLFPVEKCLPAGLAVGPGNQLLVGCSDDAVAAGFAAKSLVMGVRTGAITARFLQVGGSDQVWFDPKSMRYYLAAVANPGGPVLGIIDAHSDRWIANIPTGPRAHSVAADAASGKVFVPVAASNTDDNCRSGCVRVYATKTR